MNPTEFSQRYVFYINRHPYFAYIIAILTDRITVAIIINSFSKPLFPLTMRISPTITRNYSLIIVFMCILCVSSNARMQKTRSEKEEMEKRFNTWMKKYERKYVNISEWNLRLGIYKSNVQLIQLTNSQNLTYKLTDNQFADMTNQEFQSIYFGYKSHQHSHKKYRKTFNNSVIPSTIDWRKQGAVTSVKKQGNCGSCWAFSAVAAIEGITRIKTGELTSLSVQELVDCDKGANHGCFGGYMVKAYEFIIKNGGISTENDYPYQGKNGICDKSKAKHKAANISGYEEIPPQDEKAIQAVVANQPVSVGIDAKGYGFQLYSKGIFNGFCTPNLNHGVTIVGYGEEEGVQYWLVKNSWGSGWGEDGYIRMKRGSENKYGICGIALQASYPTKDS